MRKRGGTGPLVMRGPFILRDVVEEDVTEEREELEELLGIFRGRVEVIYESDWIGLDLRLIRDCYGGMEK